MLPLIRRPIGPGGRRRGVTLVEMLVVVALVVLMMVILVQIFQTATGAMSASRTIQELDANLRQVDSVIRSDLNGITACMDPSLGHNTPDEQRGYFEYGENAFADAQGEDTDDYMAFTTKAPEGQVFSGRQYLANLQTDTGARINPNVQPSMINSQLAEVVYFLRNGNLYRRVFLIVPDRNKSIRTTGLYGGGFSTSIFGAPNNNVSWLGMNDISARPGGVNATGNPNSAPLLNNLGDLSQRENRAFRPRFINDFTDNSGTTGPDGIPDDRNGDGVPDYWPTLYTDGHGGYGSGSGPNQFTLDPNGSPARVGAGSYSVYPFPFIYPGMFSVPDQNRLGVAANLGWVHSLLPASDANHNLVLNHGALDVGDNLLLPTGKQTWWGFPTWRETMAGYRSDSLPGWTDPINFLARVPGQTTQPIGLIPFPPNVLPATTSANLLPPVTVAETSNSPPFADPTAGSASFVAIPGAPGRVWEDDLLLSGVRSFDIKAYDLNAALYNTPANGYFSAGYFDLGYGAASYLGGLQSSGGSPGSATYYQAPTSPSQPGYSTSTLGYFQSTNGDYTSNEPVGFGHEGRIPPLPSDFRYYPNPNRRFFYDSNNNRYPYNIGDASAGVIRLTRVWDSWSSVYTNAYDQDYFGNGASNTSVALYPSFPAPYPSALRGIQIQIRLVDARGEKAKSITIRQDFTDKMN